MTASEICALLVIACHTEGEGIYSTAGAKAVRNALGIGNQRAAELLDKLAGRELIHRPKDIGANSMLYKEMPKREGRAEVRWIIKPDDSRRVWFSSQLVRGVGMMRKPLHKLQGCGELSARLLMGLYLYEDSISFGGVSPMAVCKKYTNEFQEEIGCGYSLFHASKNQAQAYNQLYFNLLRVKEDAAGEIKDFWDALGRLEKRGFIYECLTVFTGDQIADDMTLLYPLHTFNQHGNNPPKGEESISGEMHALAQGHSLSTADELGRFHGRFPFIADDRKNAQAVGIYRLRFRNTNPRFEEIFDGWKNLLECKNEWKRTIEFLRDV